MSADPDALTPKEKAEARVVLHADDYDQILIEWQGSDLVLSWNRTQLVVQRPTALAQLALGLHSSTGDNT